MDISQVRNPYDYRHPVRDAALFAGRSQEAADIAYELGQAGVDESSVCVVLHGRRAAGKTSLLHAIERMATERGLTSARVELVQGDGDPIWFFRKVYEEVVRAVAAEAARSGTGLSFDVADVLRVMAGGGDAATVAPLQFPEAIALAEAGRRVPEAALRDDLSFFVRLLGHPIAMLVDEAQLIADDGHVLSILRFLTTRVDGLVLVLAGTSELIERIKDVHSQILRQFREIEVKGFVEDVDVRECVLRPLRSAGIYGELISRDTVSALNRVTDGNPYAIQLYCHEMFARVKQGLTQDMALSPDVLEGIKSRMESGERNILDRPLIRVVREMDRNGLIAVNILMSSLGNATADEVWFAHCMVGEPKITREEYDACRADLVAQGILADEDIVRLSEEAELFDEVYCRLWSARTIGFGPHSQAISHSSVRSTLINRLLGLLHTFEDAPLRVYPTCCHQMRAKDILASFDALDKLPAEGPDSIKPVDYLHLAVLIADEPRALDVTSVTCTYDSHSVERWLYAPDSADASLADSAAFHAAAARIAALGGSLTAERVRVPLRTWPAEQWFLKSTGRLRADLADNHRIAAFLAYGAGDRDRARARFQSSFDLNPVWGTANSLMYLSLAARRKDDALEWSRKALELAEGGYERGLCLYNAAMAHLMGGDRNKAVEELARSAAELAPVSVQNHLLDFLLLPDVDDATALHEETDVNLVEAVERARAALGAVSGGADRSGRGAGGEAEGPAETAATSETAAEAPATEGGAAAKPEPVVGDERPAVVLSVATEWSSAHGGLSTFNRDLCRSLASSGAQVFCVVLDANPADVADARQAGVTLVPAPERPGASEDVRLTSRPSLPPGTVPDLVLGHGRITGPAALKLHEDFYPSARRLHFLHMSPDTIEWYKPGRANDAALRAEERTMIERQLGRSAHRVVAVGPRLHEEFVAEFKTSDGRPPLRLDPGFDGSRVLDPATPRTPPEGRPLRVLFLGRVDDARLKGVDLAAAACAQAETWLHEAGTRRGVRLIVRGAPVTDADRARGEIQLQSASNRLEVVVRVYTAEQERIDDDLDIASLVIMPSRQEGFGLVGLEAITRGIPVLVSSRSGLADLLREALGEERAGPFVVEMSGEDTKDTQTWARAISNRLMSRPAAFREAAELRTELAERIRWDQAAAVVLGEAVPR
ncbi:glycosyltransferase [Streptomyces sp. NPDC057644]|uniref:glycosyltransferase n=1 Tax=Streptomyces sp. NPDC057644 TaxID=3346191 RepID=UPI0036964C2A